MDTTDKPKLLIVDDSPQDIHLLLAELKNDYRITAATSADAALQMLEHNELPNLVLLDVNMPGIDGYEACKMIKQDERIMDIDVIFLSGNDSNEEIIRGLDVGALDYIVKPYNPDLLQSKIRNALVSHQSRLALKSQAANANSLIQTVLSETGALSEIISFMRESFHQHTPTELIECLIEAIRQFNVDVVCLFKANGIREAASTNGEVSMIELELLNRMYESENPFFEQDSRLFVHKENIVLFIKLLPDDPDKRNSLKDNLMIMLEGANAKLAQFVRELELGGERLHMVSTAIKNADDSLSQIRTQQEEHKKFSVEILDDMVKEVETAFYDLALSDEQEARLLNILQSAIDKSTQHMEKGLSLDETTNQIIATLASTAKEVINPGR